MATTVEKPLFVTLYTTWLSSRHAALSSRLRTVYYVLELQFASILRRSMITPPLVLPMGDRGSTVVQSIEATFENASTVTHAPFIEDVAIPTPEASAISC